MCFYGWCRVKSASDEREGLHIYKTFCDKSNFRTRNERKWGVSSFIPLATLLSSQPCLTFPQLLRAVSVVLRIPMLALFAEHFVHLTGFQIDWEKRPRVTETMHVVAYLPPQTLRATVGWLYAGLICRRAGKHAAWCLLASHLRTLLVKFVSPHKSLAVASLPFIFDIDLAVTSPPLGIVASLRNMMKASNGRPPWLHTKQTPLWTLRLLLFSLQFKNRGGQRPAQLVVICGSHVARAWVMLLFLVGPCRETCHKCPQTEITTTVRQ